MQILAFLLALPALATAHGYLSSPPPRGIQKESYQIDDLKSPNHKGLCRGEPVGKITHVKAGQSLTLGLTITAPHTGPCRVTILDANLKNERPVAEKYDCAAPGKAVPWTIKLPTGLSGHQVLRWYWEGKHVSPGEPYEQCIDLDFGGYNGGDEGDRHDDDGGEENHVDASRHQPETAPTYTPPVAPPAPTPSAPQYNGNEGDSRPRSPRRPSRHGGHHGGNGGAGDNQYSNGNGSSGGSCTAGSYQCASDGGFSQCANGAWVKMQCSAGTACRQNGNQIVCDWAH